MSITKKLLDLQNYTQVVGSGKFGLVVLHKKRPEVIKLFHDKQECNTAQKESARNKIVYDKVTSLDPGLQVSTSRPIAFSDGDVSHFGKHYSCAYIMTYIRSLPGYKHLIHPIFNDLYHGVKLNKIVGTKFTKSVSETNPPRGFFATPKYIDSVVLPKISNKGELQTAGDIANRVGLLYGTCIFGAHFIPIDAEYVLSIEKGLLHVSILDFGKFEDMDLKNANTRGLKGYVSKLKFGIQDTELYYPAPGSKYWEPFQAGVRQAYKFFVRSKSKSLEYILKAIL